MEDPNFTLVPESEVNSPLPSASVECSPRCVFCGMDSSAEFGQGELLRFHTLRTPLCLPDWYLELKSQAHAFKRGLPLKLNQTPPPKSVKPTPNLPLTPSDHLVGNHCALDACRRLQEGRILE